MSSWSSLSEELAIWAADGRTAAIWWRDDDVIKPSAALDRVLALVRSHQVPLALAVVPANASESLGQRLREETLVECLQHGFDHRSRAPADQKKSEFPAGRPAEEIRSDLATGARRLASLLPGRSLPLFVPPWNRIADEVLALIAEAGYLGFSTYGPRACAEPLPGLCQVNCHVDIMRWRPMRAFLGEAEALDLLVGHLRARRNARDQGTDDAEPTGILSHHLVHDEAAWRFLERLLGFLSDQAGARLISASAAFDLSHARAATGA